MNAIKNYLDNMFRNLPNIPEVRKAKAELLSMMEDKFEELIADGKSENEAVGIVISEFGNLDEVAETVGLSQEIKDAAGPAKPMLSIDRVKEYLTMVSSRSIMIPLGVALCISSITSFIMSEIIGENRISDAIGAVGFFLMIAAAVVLFITAANKNSEFKEITNGEVSLSVEAADYVRNERNRYKPTYGITMGTGIALCIVCIIFPIILSTIPFIKDDFGAILFFFSVAAGVFFIVNSNIRINGYDRLLKLNAAGEMSEEFIPQNDRKIVKWPIVLGIVAVVLVLGIAISVGVARLVYGFSFNNGKTVSTNYDLDAGEAEDIDRISIDAQACSVAVVADRGVEGIVVSYEGSEEIMPEVSFENGELIVTQDDIPSNRVSSRMFPTVTVRVGNDVEISDIDLAIDAGNLELTGVDVDDVTAAFDAGNIELRNANGRSLNLTADAGNIDLVNCGYDTIYVETDAGNIDIDDTDFENLDVYADLGNIDVSGITNIDYYSFDISCEIGEVSVDGDRSGRSYTSEGTGTGTITAECSAGAISFN